MKGRNKELWDKAEEERRRCRDWLLRFMQDGHARYCTNRLAVAIGIGHSLDDRKSNAKIARGNAQGTAPDDYRNRPISPAVQYRSQGLRRAFPQDRARLSDSAGAHPQAVHF